MSVSIIVTVAVTMESAVWTRPLSGSDYQAWRSSSAAATVSLRD